jgi:hypothetical protein
MSTAHHRRRPKPVLSIVNNTATLAVLAKEVVHVLLATIGDHNLEMTTLPFQPCLSSSGGVSTRGSLLQAKRSISLIRPSAVSAMTRDKLLCDDELRWPGTANTRERSSEPQPFQQRGHVVLATNSLGCYCYIWDVKGAKPSPQRK